MDDRTSEQRRADDALLEAIQQVVRLQPLVDDDGDEQQPSGDEIVTEYVVVAAARTFALLEENSTRYSLITMDSGRGPRSMPSHHVIGLLQMGMEL